MNDYKVVSISNNIPDYPECKEDTENYPHLLKYVEDEMDRFVISSDNPDKFWPASEFFYMVEMSEFRG